ncbi:MAG: tetratricopeptide (TPR) repeat protein [Myxococcota bacterium]|jgi:tetratricopeptide (TPR) repeat protein
MLSLLLLTLTADAATMRGAQHMVVSNPDSPESWVELGDAYRRRLKRRRAREAYGRALSLAPDHEDASRKLSRISSRRNPRIVRTALRDPTNDEVWGDVGDYYLSVGLNEEALSAYQYALRLDPADSEWHRAVINLGDIDAVIEIINSTAENASDETLGDMGDILRENGRNEEACELYRQALSMDPTDTEWTPRVAECDGIVMPDGGAIDGMISSMGSISSGSPIDMLQGRVYADSELLTRLGIAHAKAGDLGDARKYLKSALLLSPADTAALESFAAVTGQTRLEILERLVEEVPGNDEVLGELGDELLANARAREAAVYYRRALEIDDDDPEWTEKLALVEAVLEHR